MKLRAGLPPLPARMRALPVSEKGYPVPWFVKWDDDGKPDFRVGDMEKMVRALRYRLCWTCGQPLGRYLASVVGPMCTVNRVTSEPPSHRECAIFAAQACPFLTLPHAQRRDANLPDGVMDPPGIHFERNPGGAVVWIGRDLLGQKMRGGGLLFHLPEPTEVLWYVEGQLATRERAAAALEAALPVLREVAAGEGPEAPQELEQAIAIAKRYLPSLDITPR